MAFKSELRPKPVIKEFWARPCPFCGGKPELVHTRPFWVECTSLRCGASGPSRKTPGRAVRSWNDNTREGGKETKVTVDIATWKWVYGAT